MPFKKGLIFTSKGLFVCIGEAGKCIIPDPIGHIFFA